MYVLSSLRRNAISFAISSALPIRGIQRGMPSTVDCVKNGCVIGVSTAPGLMQLSLMFLCPSSCAALFVRPMTPCYHTSQHNQKKPYYKIQSRHTLLVWTGSKSACFLAVGVRHVKRTGCSYSVPYSAEIALSRKAGYSLNMRCLSCSLSVQPPSLH